MYIIPVDINQLIDECPFVLDWIETLKRDIMKSEYSLFKIESYYSYGFFVKKSENTMDSLFDKYQENSQLLYDDRLKVELEKVRVSATIKLGNTVLTNRLPKGYIPKSVKDLIEEITKVKMTMEYEDHGYLHVKNSIPPMNPNIIVEFEDLTKEEEQEIFYDIDEILDKISNDGYDSLTEDEKKFLDKKSKDV